MIVVPIIVTAAVTAILTRGVVRQWYSVEIEVGKYVIEHYEEIKQKAEALAAKAETEVKKEANEVKKAL